MRNPELAREKLLLNERIREISVGLRDIQVKVAELERLQQSQETVRDDKSGQNGEFSRVDTKSESSQGMNDMAEGKKRQVDALVVDTLKARIVRDYCDIVCRCDPFYDGGFDNTAEDREKMYNEIMSDPRKVAAIIDIMAKFRDC